METTSEAHEYINFMELLGRLKHLKRTGWVIKNIPDPETISGHMYRMAVLSFLIDPKANLNKMKIMEMALVHDLAECIVGDITPHCGVSAEDKHRMEDEAMEEICKNLGARGVEMLKTFREYEKQESPEARYVKDLDRVDLLCQAYEYEKRDECPGELQEFFDASQEKVEHPFLAAIVKEINRKRKEVTPEKLLNGN
ncbi:5'-deoxynucleotidase HDDC2 [Phymastichus coffea]|uniref:5'-deoxynucleotidase HDDC2 n=1 Tax=Phymastichus coffea TaxID=108790 RepID=UPI00273C4EDD|nr:5'-deoxynucleotidase HDDC2 [Phymastichus coffea]